ncbi:hypothetical protein C7271_08750 [filamentous cyanobacterium CCP5]|nr:hypothetical protein C7271_08750 [filamentous cyanobacterium CCP5]
MRAPSRRTQRRRPPAWKTALDRLSDQPTPWLWLLGCIVVYAIVGLILGGLPSPYWVWIIALGAILAQAIALAGPKTLARFRWWFANLLALLATVGAGALAVALAISLGFVGSASLAETLPRELILEIIQYALIALVTAATGDRLMVNYRRLQASLILASSCVLGLALGGIVGLSIA